MKRSGQKMLVALLAIWPAAGHASSEEAWEGLRDRLIGECQSLAEAAAPDAQIAVTPNEFGSERFAVALVTTRSATDTPPELAVCLMDKRSGAVELSTSFLELPDLSSPVAE